MFWKFLDLQESYMSQLNFFWASYVVPPPTKRDESSKFHPQNLLKRWFNSWPFYPRSLEVTISTFERITWTHHHKEGYKGIARHFQHFSTFFWLPCRLAVNHVTSFIPLPIASMYDIFTYIYHKHQPNVGKYTIHGCYGLLSCIFQSVSGAGEMKAMDKAMQVWMVMFFFGKQ